MVILHLSDIHFGRDNPQYEAEGEFKNKKEILRELLVSIKNNAAKPDHIVVTGDVAWFGKKEDFDEALIWFKELLSVTNLSGSDITFCPGNHDVNRSYGNYNTELDYKDIDAIDQLYQYECVHKMESPLYNYDKFCEALGVVPYHYPKAGEWEVSYAIGYKDIVLSNEKTFRIVSFNTALLSFVKKYPDDQMLIGQSQVMDLLKYNLIGDKRTFYTIALFHHAERFLHTHEICEYNHRYATLPLLRRYVDLVLCGHTETGGIPVLYKQIGGAEMVTGGAAYYSDDHANSYSMVFVLDAQLDEMEREVFIYPYTYSSEGGWHQNIRRDLPKGDGTIITRQPDFSHRSDFELILSYDDKSLSIPMKSVSICTYKNNTATLSNSEDVCRNLDIFCRGSTKKRGTSIIDIKTAKTKENSVEALLARESVYHFLDRATNAKNGSFFKIVDDVGNIILSGENICCNEKIQDEGLDFLKKVRKIELNYDLNFQCPTDNAEHKKVDVLNELIEQGYTMSFKALPRLETYSENKKQLFKLGMLSLLNKQLYVLHSGKFRCCLYGNDFLLGNVTVLMGPYTTRGSGIIRKAITYAKDDKRKINFSLCDNSVCYFITDESKIDIESLIKNTGDFIKVDNMDCVWDFIYETPTVQNVKLNKAK